MKTTFILLSVTVWLMSAQAFAQVPVTENTDHAAMLTSDDPQLAKNKRLVYDMWRTLLEARHLDQADKFMAEDYIQHNPAVATGRKAFVDFFSRFGGGPGELKDRISGKLVAIVAEGDLVVLSFARELENPNKPGEKYTTTWFDMFRVKNNKVVEHWDYGTIRAR